MKKFPSIAELGLLCGLVLLFALALISPPLTQNQDFHAFIDVRSYLGIPRTFDVLSNLGFLILGMYGIILVLKDRLQFFNRSLKASAVAFFLGFIATAFGSAYYHVAPNDSGLAWDRLGMVIVFAGMLGLAGAHRISERAGWLCLFMGLLAGPVSVLYWNVSGSLSPYVIVQHGGIALACATLFAKAKGPGPWWWLMIAAYAAAKYCEGHDAQIFELTHQLVSGHTLKHLLATIPALAVIWPLKRPVQ